MGWKKFLRNQRDRGSVPVVTLENMGNSQASSVALEDLARDSAPSVRPERHVGSNGDLTAATASTGNTATIAAATTTTGARKDSNWRNDDSRHSRGRRAHHGPRHVFSTLAHVVGKLGHAVEHALVPPMTTSHHREQHLPKIKLLLKGCKTSEEHREYVTTVLDRVRELHGREGLRAVGFDYKVIYCLEHRSDRPSHREESLHENPSLSQFSSCQECATRLYHVDTNTLINEENRQHYIADGEMYEAMARLCQEYAQNIMQQEGELEWVIVCNDETEAEPIRALVHMDHHLASGNSIDRGDDQQVDPDERPILLVLTGKGKVRAGIFSRQHLMTTGVEASTAVPMVREASRRNMSIIILDPNARGDQRGMDTFEKSVELLLGHLGEGGDTQNSVRSLYVVAHSASGSQLVRYLLDRVHVYSPYLRAIAFTDSTHNIQWARDNAQLRELLGSSQCIYFRSANEHRDTHWHTRKAGAEAETDHFWTHRFGGIRTLWAGTKEHSLTNWFAHSHIWDHFDGHLLSDPLHIFSRRQQIEEHLPRREELSAVDEELACEGAGRELHEPASIPTNRSV